jgi:hypothetical protein
MTSRFVLMVAVVIAAAGTVASAWRLLQARARSQQRIHTMQLVATDARQVVSLRGHREHSSLAPRPTSDVLARVNQTLSDCGLPASTLRDLVQEGDTVIDQGAPVMRRQVVVATLEPVELDQLGRFLHLWTDNQPLWTPFRLDMTHVGSDDAPTYGCRVSLAATYFEEAGP